MPNLKDDLASLRIDQSARAGTSRRGLWITIAVILVAVATAGWVWSTRIDAIEVKAVAVKAETGGGPAPGAVLNASGYITARRRATVSSKVTGKVLEVFVEEGKAVHKGQVLARLDDSQVRASLAVGQAQLETARRGAAEDEARLREATLTLGRRQQLVKERVISKAELDSAQAEVESLKARIEVAQQQIRVAESVVSQRRTDLADMVRLRRLRNRHDEFSVVQPNRLQIRRHPAAPRHGSDDLAGDGRGWWTAARDSGCPVASRHGTSGTLNPDFPYKLARPSTALPSLRRALG